MAISYPYSTAFLADRLPIQSVRWDIERYDEFSGSGDGRMWQAEMASPLWTADVILDKAPHLDLDQIAALIRKLHGAQEAFFLYSPTRQFPAADPKGLVLGAATVQVASIGPNRTSIALKGLPAGYTLTLADKLSIAYSAAPTRYAFLEFCEGGTASGGGITGQIEVFPHVPVGVASNHVVTLAKPACRMVIVPGSHNPGRARRTLTDGAAFRCIEKKVV